jgi:hypothetical protein
MPKLAVIFYMLIFLSLGFAGSERAYRRYKAKPITHNELFIVSANGQSRQTTSVSEDIVLASAYEDQIRQLRANETQTNLGQTRIEMPSKIQRGETIKVQVYLPTVSKGITTVTMVMTNADAYRLTPGDNGSFHGTIHVPETMTMGIQKIAFYFRNESGEVNTIERLIKIE